MGTSSAAPAAHEHQKREASKGMVPAGFRGTAELDRSHSPEFTEPSGRGPEADPESRCQRFGIDAGVLTDSGQQLIYSTIYSLTPVRKGKRVTLTLPASTLVTVCGRLASRSSRAIFSRSS